MLFSSYSNPVLMQIGQISGKININLCKEIGDKIMTYVVSKQHYFYSGEYAVEVAAGGLDCAGCDALSIVGEWNDPRDAVEVAINTWLEWGKEMVDTNIILTYGYNLDMIEGSCCEQETIIEDIRLWGEQEYSELDKCDRCGDILSDNDDHWVLHDYDGYTFCSENCADKYYWDNLIPDELEYNLEGCYDYLYGG